MPVYEYQCESCGRVFELIQKFSDEPLTIDENCGGRVHRLLSAPALQFKGSGWYVTDYAKGGSAPNANGKPAESSEAKPASTESSGSSSSTGSKSTGSESKPTSSTSK